MSHKRSFYLILLLKITLIFLMAGFWFHTSAKPEILRKYSASYFMFLCLITVIFFLGYFFLKWLFKKSEIKVTRNRTITFISCHKWLTTILILVIFTIIGESILYFHFHQSLLKERRAKIGEYHPFLQISYQAGNHSIRTNKWGFRGEEISKKKTGKTYRIFVLGGSTVACKSINHEKTYCRILELSLRKKYPYIKVEVQNAGVDWYSSQHSLIKYLTYIQNFNPDLVIVMHAINDLYRGFSPPYLAKGDYRPDYSHFYGPVSSVLNVYTSGEETGLLLPKFFMKYWFSDFLQPEASKKFKKISNYQWRSLVSFKRNMRNLVRNIMADNVIILLASQPFLYKEDMTDKEEDVLRFNRFCQENGKIPDISSMMRGMEIFNNSIKNISHEENVPFLDLVARIPKTLEFFYDDVHYTEKGNSLMAYWLEREIVSRKFIEKRFPEPD